MANTISEIYFFGSLADGFKVYPAKNSSSNWYSSFYNNTEENYKLHIVKKGDSVTYTYVKYGLLTSLNDGRTGSFFGLSIVFNNKYFNNIDVFINKICVQIFKALIKEKIILSQNDSTGAIGYVAYDFNSVAPQLNDWITRIRAIISEKYSIYLSSALELADPISEKIDGLNDSSANTVILEIIKEKGAILLGPQFPVINLTKKEQLEIQSADWENRFTNLKIAYDVLQKEKKRLESDFNNLKSINQNLYAKLKKKGIKLEDLGPKESGQENINTGSIKSIPLEEIKPPAFDYIKTPKNKTGKAKKRSIFLELLPIFLAIIVIAVLVIVAFFFLNDDNKPERSTNVYEYGENQNSNNYLSQRETIVTNDIENTDSCLWNDSTTLWAYRGTQIKSTNELVKYITDLLGKSNCIIWSTKITNFLIINNPSDIKNGHIESFGNILFRIPVTFQLPDKDFSEVKIPK